MNTATPEQLLARVESLERETKQLKDRVPGAEEPTTSLPARTVERNTDDHGGATRRLPRGRFLKAAGAVVAGAAGAALLGGRDTRGAYAMVSDTNFVATGPANVGFDAQATGGFVQGGIFQGTNVGVHGTATGPSAGGIIGVVADSTAAGATGFSCRLTGSQSTGISAFSDANDGIGGIFAGGRAAMRILPSTAAVGPPTAGYHGITDVWTDANGNLYMCTVSGTPGTWVPIQQAGLNNALFTVVSTQQYSLTNSDGNTWQDIDSTNLKLTIRSNFNCQAVISGSADLWTSTVGFNQDIGIYVSGAAYPTTAAQPEAWKESGGPGTYSPNAAFVEAIVPLSSATTYTVKLQWKANKSGASKIWAGAGPILGKFSPTRLTAFLILS
jgi:hypothetical protein